MSATLTVGKTAIAVLHEFSGAAEVSPVGPVTYSSSDATIATVDPASGLVTAVAVGTCTITGSDANGNGTGVVLAASDMVTNVAASRTATLVITPN